MKDISKCEDSTTKCGYVAIIGRPNVGKSTLLNKILGKKISIISRKPQTTRDRILGIKTERNIQAIYVDTPGLHKGEKRALNRFMNREAYSAMKDVDVVVLMVEGLAWEQEDDWILQKISQLSCPVILVVNKADKIIPKERLLPQIEKLSKKMHFVAIIPMVAKKGTNVGNLEAEVAKLLPSNPFFFSAEQVTDRQDQFLASEIIREKLIKFLGQEIPYATAVRIDHFAIKNKILHIAATIFVEKDGQKAIIIGKGGEKLKHIGTLARQELESFFGCQVFLQLWVKVKSGWTESDESLKRMGYTV
jgi:GTP-binding protein Era